MITAGFKTAQAWEIWMEQADMFWNSTVVMVMNHGMDCIYGGIYGTIQKR